MRIGLRTANEQAITLGKARLTATPFPPSTLYAYSGFASAVNLPAYANPAQDQARIIHGTDAASGWNWDTAPSFYNSYDPLKMTIIVGPSPGGNTQDYQLDDIISTDGPVGALAVAGDHSGATKNAMKLQFVKPSPATSVMQTFMESSRGAGVGGSSMLPIVDYYMRCWVRFDPNMLALAQAQEAAEGGTPYWRDIWEYKTYTDYRQILYIEHQHGGSNLHFAMVADTGGWDAQHPSLQTVWTADSTVADANTPNAPIYVPQDQWFWMEIYMHRSTGSDGRWFFAIGHPGDTVGTVVFDRHGSNYGVDNANVGIMAHSMLYHHNQGAAAPGGTTEFALLYQYITSMEIRDYPPAALPGGPPPF